MTKGSTKEQQGEFAFPQHGGARPGAGRKPRGPLPRVPHVAREEIRGRHPVHVTLRVVAGLRNLREGRAHGVLLNAIVAGADRNGFRIVEYSAQSNHLHLLCEAPDRAVLWHGVQGLKVRITHALNRLWEREGALFADRYHDRVLRSPREVHHVLTYLFENASHHGIHHSDGLDPCSSARWFHGERPSPLPKAQTWLASVGWQRWGPIEVMPRTVPRGFRTFSVARGDHVTRAGRIGGTPD